MLVVDGGDDGNLQISGEMQFPNTAIFCTGRIIISGKTEITGLLYAGTSLTMSVDSKLNGVAVVDGLATVSGDIENNNSQMKEYLNYLRKTDLK